MTRILCPLALLPFFAFPALADPFDKPGYGIASGVTWVSSVENLIRGPLDIADPGLGNASAGDGANTLGPATGVSTDTVSLGDGGSIIVSFELSIGNDAGDDLAVFENGFFSGDELFGDGAARCIPGRHGGPGERRSGSRFRQRESFPPGDPLR